MAEDALPPAALEPKSDSMIPGPGASAAGASAADALLVEASGDVLLLDALLLEVVVEGGVVLPARFRKKLFIGDNLRRLSGMSAQSFCSVLRYPRRYGLVLYTGLNVLPVRRHYNSWQWAGFTNIILLQSSMARGAGFVLG